jgi:hypothetical protein
MKGKAGNDLGQMAVVSGFAGSQVMISYRQPTGVIKTRRKQRMSLIRMEEGAELVPMHVRAQRTDRRRSILPQYVFRSYSVCSDPTHASRCDRSPITDHRNADHVASLN